MRLRVIPKCALVSRKIGVGPRLRLYFAVLGQRKRDRVLRTAQFLKACFTFWPGMSNAPNGDTFDFQSDGEALSPLFRSTPSSSETTDSGQQSQLQVS